MTDPLSEIEQRRDRMGLGEQAGDLFRGARGGGCSYLEAVGVVAGWMLALLRNGDEPEQEEGDA